jgi:GMP reductase
VVGFVNLFKKEYLDYNDVLILPQSTKVTSRKEVKVAGLFEFKPPIYRSFLWGTPLIVSNMDSSGTIEVAREAIKQNIFTCLHKHYTVDELIKFFNERPVVSELVFVTIGLQELIKLLKLKEFSDNFKQHPMICIDVANGYMDKVVETIKAVRYYFPTAVIMAGNVCTKDMVKAYAKAGVDIVKVGIGPSSVCKTRVTAGVGVPQLTAVQDCVKAAKKYNVKICADGGINEYADFVKAIAVGADFVMVGSMLGGHNESGGDIVYNDKDEPMKKIRGMSSWSAMKDNGTSKEDVSYRASEGRVYSVPLRGPIKDTFNEFLGSLRSACSYVGAFNIDQFKKKAKLIRVNQTHNRKYESVTTEH